MPSLERIMESITYLSIFSHNLWIFGECKQSEDNCIANRSFTSCYNSNILTQIIGKYMLISLNFASGGNIFPSLKEDKSTKTHNFRIKFGNGLLVRGCSLHISYLGDSKMKNNMWSIIQVNCNLFFCYRFGKHKFI